MRPLTIIDGGISSGHFVFIRDAGTLSDAGFLAVLGLRDYAPDREPRFPCHYAHIMRAGDWSGFADDWFYTAYNSASIGDAISQLGQSYDVLKLAIGDADQSFEFYHFLDGSLCRGFHFRAWAGKSSVILDIGSPLMCESTFQLGSAPCPFMWVVADEMGIDSRAMAESVLTYSKPYRKP